MILVDIKLRWIINRIIVMVEIEKTKKHKRLTELAKTSG